MKIDSQPLQVDISRTGNKGKGVLWDPLFLEVSVTFSKLDTTYKSKGMLSRHNMTLTTEVYQEGTPCRLESVLLTMFIKN